MPTHPPDATMNFTSPSIDSLPLLHSLPLLDRLVTSLLSPLVPPSQPCLFEGHSPSPTLTTQFEPDCSSLTLIVFSGVPLLVPTSTMACLLPLPCHCRPDCSLPGPCVISSPMARVSPPLCCLTPDRSHPTPLCHFKPNGSCLALSIVLHQIIHIPMPFMLFQAQLLISHPNHAQTLISMSLRVLISCFFNPRRSSPTSTQYSSPSLQA